MPPTILTGTRDTLNILQTRRKIDIDDVILNLFPNEAPLTVLLKRLSKKSAINPKFQCLEDEFMPEWDAINHSGGYAEGDTSLTVDNGDYFSVDDLIKVPRTGEVMLVTAVTGNVLTVVRSLGATAAAALNDNEPILCITNAVAEGATLRTIKSTKVVEGYNYTQIFRHAAGATGTEDASELYGGQDRAYQVQKRGREHLIDIEKAFWFGERAETADAVTGKPQRATGGILEFVSTYKTDAGGALTNSEFETFVQDAFTYGSEVKILFASSLLMTVLNAYSLAKIQTVPAEETFGVKCSRYVSPHGELLIVKNRWFTGATYGGYGVAVDLESFKYRYLNGRDTHLERDRQANDEDGWKDEYLTECGLERKQEKRNAVLYGVTS